MLYLLHLQKKHLRVLGMEGKTGLQGLQVYASTVNPMQAPRDFPDVVGFSLLHAHFYAYETSWSEVTHYG